MAAQNIQKTNSVTITRPTNTTGYVAGDVINGNGSTAMLEIKVNCLDNSNAWLVGGQAIDSVAQALLQFDVLFFSANIAINADNAPFNPSVATMNDSYLGRISFSSFLALGSNSISDGITASTKPIIVTPNVQSIYAVLVATAAYTPASAETITIKFDYQQI